MSSIVRVRGKKRNRAQHSSEVVENRKQAQLSYAQDGTVDMNLKKALSRIEQLPLEILEIIFTYGRNLSLINVSRHMRYLLLGRHSFINRFIVKLFLELGFCPEKDPFMFGSSSFDNQDDAAECFGQFVLYPGFDSSFIWNHVREWLLRRAETCLKGWVADQTCLKEEDFLSALKRLENEFDFTFGLVNQPDVELEGTKYLPLLSPKATRAAARDLELRYLSNTGELKLRGDRWFQISTQMTQYDVVTWPIVECGEYYIPEDVERDKAYIWPRKFTPENWTKLLPEAICRAPFTKSKGDYLHLILELISRYHYLDRFEPPSVRDCFSRLSSGLADALETGCGPAISCLSFGMLNMRFLHTELSSVVKLGSPKAVDSPDPESDFKDQTKYPWKHRIGRPLMDESHFNDVVRAETIRACLKGFHIFPEGYLEILSRLCEKLESKTAMCREVSDTLYNFAQKQEPKVKKRILEIWNRFIDNETLRFV